jgi:hypothetical protein
MKYKPFVVAATCLAACGVIAGPAIAAKQPTAKQTVAIERAVLNSPELKRIPSNRYRIVGERVSTASRYWAYAQVRPRAAFQDTMDDAEVILVRPADSRRRIAVDFGTGLVGCGLAPEAVIADLRGVSITQACPPEERIGS